MIRRPPRSTLSSSSAASDVYKRQVSTQSTGIAIASMSVIKEVLGRVSKKFKDFVHLNPEYVGRQFDTAPVRFKDAKPSSIGGYKSPGVADAHYTEGVNVPTLQAGRSKFNTRYFDRDTRRAEPLQEIALGGSTLKMIEGVEAESSSALTGIELLPAHLPKATWEREVDKIQAHAKANGLPPAAGAPHRWGLGGAQGGVHGFA
eukprot:TRINITY_DN6185_c0_g1_i1.p1 TRINITY_DN6185_c0_g1~~TRINITY_DN6185_c0_g1_i1.p1  ORF type:complete len:203 (-),score=46.60 TRINITY_DN6185_c0_g1_i1:174-782(-)